MRVRRNHRQLQHGGSYVEILVAGLLLSIGVMAIVNVWRFSFVVTTRNDEMSVAYILGRRAMENVKIAGFSSAAEGSTTLYYDGLQNQVASSSSSARYAVTTSVVSDIVKSGTSGVAGAVPANTALRTVTIVVSRVGGGELYRTTTYLARAGI